HYGSFRPTSEVLAAWQRTAEVALAMRAEIVLLQCPASFRATPEHVSNLQRFFERVERHGLAFAWEPRGPWAAEQVTALCREMQLIHACDPIQMSARRYQSLANRAPMSKFVLAEPNTSNGGFRYYRVHGIGHIDYQYTADELQDLAAWVDPGPAYVFFNNVPMLDDARRFRDCLVAKRQNSNVPARLPRVAVQQGDLF